MQLRLKPRTSRSIISRNLVFKTILIFVVFILGIFLLDRIEFPTPTKLIKQKLGNDKLIILK
jgi:hypothetical protein